MIRTCQCGTHFEPKRPWAKFCSRACQNRATQKRYRRKVKKALRAARKAVK